MNTPSCLFVIRTLPSRLTVQAEILDQILMAAAFDLPVSVLFLDNGVFTLKDGQIEAAEAGRDISDPALARRYGALACHDNVDLLVETESMEARCLDPEDLCMPVRMMRRSEIRNWMASHERIISQ